jgi:diguanylate cyclase (GGDEF)-like protein
VTPAKVGGAGEAARSAAAGPGLPAVGDTASILGLSEAELTPKVRQAIMTLLAEVDNLRRSLEQTHRRLADMERLADQDTLVPLPNRRSFVRELTRVMAYAQRYAVPAALLYFDLNDFKAINDRHGHAVGDAALQRVAQTLTENVRGSDIVGRIGGDEFAIILIQVDEAKAREKAAALALAIQTTPLVTQGQTIPISAAYGLSMLNGADPGAALAAADRAMYSRKQAQKAAI